VSGLGAKEMAEVLTVQAGEMLRIWRLARHSIQPDMLPGLADGALESFFAALGPLLARGAPPGEVAGALRGTLRLPPGGADGAISEEWEVARQVLRAACESLGASEALATWLDQAATAGCQTVLGAARGDPGAPRSLVLLWVFTGLALRPRTV
jgi:hypothetical protein